MQWEGWNNYGEKIAWSLSQRDGYQLEEILKLHKCKGAFGNFFHMSSSKPRHIGF
jgi:hypothetical protein